ncbi:MAG TPA: GIY-YIG nuclease family protein [Thermoanaerobaculia bacterium]|jgi:putative endonuclease|nr:GIY-YIG nuclease family protein [Thermoanaerobaculia bacterium]
MPVTWFVYIVSNNAHTLYTGMTDDLPNRVTEHKDRTYINGFTARYTFDRLVYYEAVGSQKAAAKREKQVKGWPRAKRVALIQAMNPNWIDLHRSLVQLLRAD